ncbi:MAG: bifunctional methylenetetrahydrofolate dehydrogenase/methenyltetrahydrofolate cyclohydrolase FolD [Elusimicrobiota bacterium]|jgi:methylenetetrahydrofolate dehydrogenase (NADP+)/methenyltetrahydrofolate cyclohydrolase|nr:bifunctional methylenetetrahydrofolate dehydrogenase/methenyltetrahydrofolate cyclohydrolase FolD [Elusimicrobiota bacterium]
MILIDGKKIANDIRSEIKEKVEQIKFKTNSVPCLATILVGENPASRVYINSKIKACQECGVKSVHHNLKSNSSKEEIINLINQLNINPKISAILLQLPFSDAQTEQECINAISPNKDADGLHPFNAGLLTLFKSQKEISQNNVLTSCTPTGIIRLLQKSDIEIAGKTAVVAGRSNLVGKPASLLLLANDATVIMAHSKTKNLKELCKSADILITAVGKPQFINKDFIKDGAAVIDVGINRTENGLVGDIDFDSVKDMNIKITPVPGGVGPMTIAMLLENTLKAYRRNL